MPLFRSKNQKKEEFIAMGIFGTSEWKLTSTGVLYIGPGTFGPTQGYSPWIIYYEQICCISFEGKVKADAQSSHLFCMLSQTQEIKHLFRLDTSKVEQMDLMFYFMDLDSLDLSGFDTSNVKTMSRMLGNLSLNEIKLGKKSRLDSKAHLVMMADTTQGYTGKWHNIDSKTSKYWSGGTEELISRSSQEREETYVWQRK